MMHKTHKKKVLNKSKKSKVKNAFRLSNNKKQKKYFRKTKNQKIQKGGKMSIDQYVHIRNYPTSKNYFWNQFILSSFWVYNYEDNLKRIDEKYIMESIFKNKDTIVDLNNSISYLIISETKEFYIILDPFKSKLENQDDKNNFFHRKIIIQMKNIDNLIEKKDIIIERIYQIYAALKSIYEISNPLQITNNETITLIDENKTNKILDRMETVRLLFDNCDGLDITNKNNTLKIPCYDVEALINIHEQIEFEKCFKIAVSMDRLDNKILFIHNIISIISTLYFNYLKITLNRYKSIDDTNIYDELKIRAYTARRNKDIPNSNSGTKRVVVNDNTIDNNNVDVTPNIIISYTNNMKTLTQKIREIQVKPINDNMNNEYFLDLTEIQFDIEDEDNKLKKPEDEDNNKINLTVKLKEQPKNSDQIIYRKKLAEMKTMPRQDNNIQQQQITEYPKQAQPNIKQAQPNIKPAQPSIKSPQPSINRMPLPTMPPSMPPPSPQIMSKIEGMVNKNTSLPPPPPPTK
jgi:hypothetical protein